jgi:hypothetical protein
MRVLATSVVRSTHKGQSHGGVFLVDLERESFDLVVDWDRVDIDWTGRGLDRGLRGIAFHGGLTYIAASEEILVLDHEFRIVNRFANPYLRHCHEIDLCGDTLWLTSTGFDSLLAFDLRRGAFTDGLCFRPNVLDRWLCRRFPILVPMRRFDPNRQVGPGPGDTLHLNMVFSCGGSIYCSGTGFRSMMRIEGDAVRLHAKIPRHTHNVQLFAGGVLMNHTSSNLVRLARTDGTTLEEWPVPHYDPATLSHRDLPEDHARQGFGRGLCTTEDGQIVVGSSPATVSLFERGRETPVRRVTLTRDVRNAIHGLEIYPF